MTDLQLVAKKIAEERTGRERALLRGAVEDFAGYRQLVGVILGLTLAENILNDLVQRLENSDE